MAEVGPGVLVVDPERFFRDAIVELLEEAGIACDAVAGGASVLSRCVDPKLGVVVLDVGLREPDAVEVLRAVRERRPAVRLIALSAEPDHGRVLQALREGACDYLAKPLHDEELVLAVRRALAAYDVEQRWARLRARLERTRLAASRLAAWDDDGSAEALEAFARAAVAACAEAVDATRTSLMLYDEAAGQLRVAAATGSGVDAAAMDPVALGEGVAGAALCLGEALLVDDVYSDAQLAPHVGREGYATASLAAVPLRAADVGFGVLCATDRAGDARFTEDELALMQLLAAPILGFLRGRRLAPPPAAAVGTPGPAAAVCEALVQEVDPDAVYGRVLAAASRALGGAPVALHLIDNRSGQLVLEHEVRAGGAGDRARLPRDRGLTGQVLQGAEAVVSRHPERDDHFDPDVDTASDGEGSAFVCLPLRLRGTVMGVLRAHPEGELASLDRAVEGLGIAVSAAVRNVLLYRSLLESIDELSEARREARGSGLA